MKQWMGLGAAMLVAFHIGTLGALRIVNANNRISDVTHVSKQTSLQIVYVAHVKPRLGSPHLGRFMNRSAVPFLAQPDRHPKTILITEDFLLATRIDALLHPPA